MCAINKPIRMCILCRERSEQKTLLRFQANGEKIIEFSKRGRSFYVCQKCLIMDTNKLLKILNAKLRMKNKNIKDFGEYFSKLVQEAQ